MFEHYYFLFSMKNNKTINKNNLFSQQKQPKNNKKEMPPNRFVTPSNRLGFWPIGKIDFESERKPIQNRSKRIQEIVIHSYFAVLVEIRSKNSNSSLSSSSIVVLIEIMFGTLQTINKYLAVYWIVWLIVVLIGNWFKMIQRKFPALSKNIRKPKIHLYRGMASQKASRLHQNNRILMESQQCLPSQI